MNCSRAVTRKQTSPIFSSLLSSWNVTFLRLLQKENASFPIVVTLLGMRISSRPLLKKQNYPMYSSPSGRQMLLRLPQWKNAQCLIYFSALPSSNATSRRLAHLENANFYIPLTPFGIVILSKALS